MNKLLKVFLISSGEIVVVSCLAGALIFMVGHSFWFGFLLATVLQLVLGGMWGAVLERRDATRLAEVNAMIEMAQAEKYIDIPCAYCNVNNTIPFYFKQANSFTCKACNNVNSVYVEFTTARKTNPVISPGDLSTAVGTTEPPISTLSKPV